mmetsp:Transcript_13958/g.16846  ORF Transcript_13958/g.16846 Transcript_13958/m.16846 type:complete len:340 (-) Transcript_13958:919-1938(-)|eukprot:CAMPEP_0197858264 /NCGR_PEP_ID=MMETSP1438-20131217/31946_1 /TAXON_ID=1461541 /ORGANISM="Pterosperma sp., Strain CCMP1384" /LENGTH=339 /DNA_ID=CAMNT_0043474369 /DNA_START=162 /DNA_END=1181 /DNA_ORIENTATION=+
MADVGPPIASTSPRQSHTARAATNKSLSNSVPGPGIGSDESPDYNPESKRMSKSAGSGTPGTGRKDYSYVQSTVKKSYSNTSSASQAQLPPLFRPGSLELLRPGLAKETGYLEVYPRIGKRKPYLLEQLELFLEEKLRQSDRLVNASKSNGGKGSRVPPPRQSAINMRLDAHRQCLELFINAFSTYRPLLQRIKEQYDMALDVALKSEQENMQLRADLMALEQSKQRAVEEARAEAASAAASQRGELARRLHEAEQRASRAEAKAEAAIAQAGEARELAAGATAEASEYRDQNRDLKQRIFDESSWAKRPLAEQVGQIMVGPRGTGNFDSASAAKPAME